MCLHWRCWVFTRRRLTCSQIWLQIKEQGDPYTVKDGPRQPRTRGMNSPPQPENRNALADETWFEASKIPTADGWTSHFFLKSSICSINDQRSSYTPWNTDWLVTCRSFGKQFSCVFHIHVKPYIILSHLFLLNTPLDPNRSRKVSQNSLEDNHWLKPARPKIGRCLLNVPLEHHPTIGDILCNKYFFKQCSNSSKREMYV